MDFGLSDRRAVVPAASSGLGLAVATALAGEGVLVAMCGRDKKRIETAAASVRGHAVPFVADVSTTDGVVGFLNEAEESLGGGVDILIANGPGPPSGTFASTSVEQSREALESSLIPVVEMCHRVVPGMQARGWGRIVAVTSLAVRQPIANLLLSNMARTGLTGFLKTLAREVAANGITVNSVQPGLHGTQRLYDVFDARLDAEVEKIPARRLGSVEEFGRVVSFLCSEHASYVTGAAIPVDGGMHAGLQ